MLPLDTNVRSDPLFVSLWKDPFFIIIIYLDQNGQDSHSEVKGVPFWFTRDSDFGDFVGKDRRGGGVTGLGPWSDRVEDGPCRREGPRLSTEGRRSQGPLRLKCQETSPHLVGQIPHDGATFEWY